MNETPLPTKVSTPNWIRVVIALLAFQFLACLSTCFLPTMEMVKPDFDRLVAELDGCRARGCQESEALKYVERHRLDAVRSLRWSEDHKTKFPVWTVESMNAPLFGGNRGFYTVEFEVDGSGRVVKVTSGKSGIAL